MAWLLLAMTVVFEVMGTTMMKLSNGFSNLWPSIGVFVCYAVSLAGITLVLRHMELSVAYAVWSGAGTALTALIGIYMFREPATAMKLLSLGLIIAGVIGLKMAASEPTVDDGATLRAPTATSATSAAAADGLGAYTRM
jgi:small multidrug resistance pump